MQVQPASLFREVIPSLLRSDHRYYFTLPVNKNVIEKGKREDGNYYRKLTPSNWERNLKHGTLIYVPMSSPMIHHHVIEKHGHDRVLELIFYNHREMPNGQTQLTFHPKDMTYMPDNWGYIACRAEALAKYPLSIYVKMTPEEIKRDMDRFMIIKWRTALQYTTISLLDSEVKKGNVHKDHASFLRSRVKRMIARTYEEHIERKRAVEHLCDMGRRYLRMVREKGESKE